MRRLLVLWGLDDRASPGSPQERQAEEDILMTKPSKQPFFRVYFSKHGLSLTKSLESFTMKPDFGPGCAAVA
jgi:hypothetical protein